MTINEAPTFRADQMPYGGVKDSGNTREGPRWAVREMTEERLVVLSLVGEEPAEGAGTLGGGSMARLPLLTRLLRQPPTPPRALPRRRRREATARRAAAGRAAA